MLAKVLTGAVLGIDAHLVEVEVDIGNGMPGFTIVGLPDKTIDESRERVRAAVRNSGYEYPLRKMVINLAPADIRKEGTGYDLPVAIGLLAGSEQLSLTHLEDYLLVGELALDGALRPVPGVLPLALAARDAGKRGVVVPRSNAEEAGLVSGLRVYAVSTLREAAAALAAPEAISPLQVDVNRLMDAVNCYQLDFAEVKGQSLAKRALEICAAGRHNALLVGPPGSGKTMLAQRFPSILPPLDFREAVDITRVYSVAGLLPDHKALITTRPFRSPHHSISPAGLVGGSSRPRPGEISLAHLGVLFLDELLEFRREVLEVMRQPLEDRKVTITRAQSSLTYPADFTLLVALNPCPCGFHGDEQRTCSCHPGMIEHYWNRLSGPLLDRIDLHVEVGRLRQEELLGYGGGESSAAIRERVERAWRIQSTRYTGLGITSNARMLPRQMKEYCRIDAATRELLRRAITQLGLSGRAFDRVLKVARTIADLEGCEGINSEHVAEAIQFRAFDRTRTPAAHMS